MLVLCNNGFEFCDRTIDCRGLVPGTEVLGARRAGPAKDIGALGTGFLTVDGTGIPDRRLERGSNTGCITERLRSMVVEARATNASRNSSVHSRDLISALITLTVTQA